MHQLPCLDSSGLRRYYRPSGCQESLYLWGPWFQSSSKLFWRSYKLIMTVRIGVTIFSFRRSGCSEMTVQTFWKSLRRRSWSIIVLRSSSDVNAIWKIIWRQLWDVGKNGRRAIILAVSCLLRCLGLVADFFLVRRPDVRLAEISRPHVRLLSAKTAFPC